MYAIKILEKAIRDHQAEINRIKAIDYEFVAEEFFAQEEINERKDYICQLQKAVSRLTIKCSDKELIDFKKQLLKQK